MKLKYPSSDIDFAVTPAYFLGDFDIYDREETLGVRLSKFDPNDETQLHELLDQYFFKGGRAADLGREHKAELIRVLGEALKNDNFDFSALVTHERDPDDYFTLPDSWDIYDPKSFFTVIYTSSLARWREI